MKVANVFREYTLEMPLIQRNNLIQWVSSALFNPSSATPFCQGILKEALTGSILRDRTAFGTSNPYVASQSKIRNLGAAPNRNAPATAGQSAGFSDVE
jgi:hypothetical protein